MIQGFSGGLLNRQLIYNLDLPSFQRDFASLKTLDHGTGPAITFTRASGATFFDANGTLQTAANDVPRFDHDPATGASRGLLIEQSRTNSIRNSQAGGSTNGVIGSGGVMPTNWAAGAGASSNGISTEIIGTGTESGLAYIDLKISGTPTSSAVAGFNLETTTQVVAANGETWTVSLFAKLIAGSLANATLHVGVDGRTSGGAAVSGQSTSTTFTATSSAVATQRKSHTATFSDATVERVLPSFQVVYTSGNPIDITLRIAAPQLEQGAFATSYIPTTNAAATRSADTATVTPISSFYNETEGSLFAEFRTTLGPFGPRVASFSITTDSNNILEIVAANASANGPFFFTRVGGANKAVAPANPPLLVANTTYKVIGAYSPSGVSASIDGATVVNSTNGEYPAGITRMRIGASGSGANIINGHIRKIAYYPKRLSNALLEQLST